MGPRLNQAFNLTTQDLANMQSSFSQGTTGGGVSTTALYPGNTIYYPYYQTYWYERPDKTSQAFRIVKALMERKLINLLTVKQFVDLVDEIVKVL